MDDQGDPSVAIGARTGLPDALKVLLARYPRQGWEAHPEFNALTRFWLDRHLMFRRLQGLLVDETQALLDRAMDPQRGAAQLARLAGLFLNELHGHHHIEDAHYFPLLRTQDARLEAGFDLLDRDHHALGAGLHELSARTDAALRGLSAAPADAAAVGALLADLERFGPLLERHLNDEEELIVPVILEHRGAGFE